MTNQNKPIISILVPVYNEEKVIPLFFDRIKPVISQLSDRYEPHLIFLNNASADGTISSIKNLAANNQNIFHLTLARNVGYQRSIEFGLRNTFADLYVFIDVDCEDPPEMILDFVKSREDGYDIVYGERVDREEIESIKFLRKVFYRTIKAVADEEVILDMAEFSLMTREVRDAIIQDSSSFPFIRASIGRVGFRRLGIPYKRSRRIAGETHYNLWGMTTFAVAGILSSSTLFLRAAIYVLPVWLLAMTVLFIYSLNENDLWAFKALLAVGFMYCGVVLSFIAMYLARVYKNTLGRPNAFLDCKNSNPQPAIKN
jgi:glycosyltransferase involved in cell wall biosynthesis